MPVLAVKTSLYTNVIRITGVFPRQHFSSWGRNYLSVTLCLSIDIIFLLPSGCKGRELSLFALLLQDRFARKTPQIGAATQTTINNPYRGLLVWLDSASWCYMTSDQKSYMSPGVTQRSGFSFLTLCWMCVCPFLQENVLITLELKLSVNTLLVEKELIHFEPWLFQSRLLGLDKTYWILSHSSW